MNLEFKTRENQQVLVCKVFDTRIDGSVVGDLKGQFEPHIQKGVLRVALDLSNVTFIDSTGLGALIALRKSLPEGSEMAIFGATKQVDKLFRLTRLNKVLLMTSTVDEAAEELSKR